MKYDSGIAFMSARIPKVAELVLATGSRFSNGSRPKGKLVTSLRFCAVNHTREEPLPEGC